MTRPAARVGRPPLAPEGSTHVTVRVATPDAAALRQLADRRGRRLSDITREAILRYLAAELAADTVATLDVAS